MEKSTTYQIVSFRRGYQPAVCKTYRCKKFFNDHRMWNFLCKNIERMYLNGKKNCLWNFEYDELDKMFIEILRLNITHSHNTICGKTINLVFAVKNLGQDN